MAVDLDPRPQDASPDDHHDLEAHFNMPSVPDNERNAGPGSRNSLAQDELNPTNGYTSAADERERRGLRDRVDGVRDRVQNAKDKVDNVKDKADKIQRGAKATNDALKAGKNLGEGVKAGVQAAKAGKAGAQAAGAASGAATVGVGTAATAAEMAAEAAVNKLRKLAKGDFSFSKKTMFAVAFPVAVMCLFIIAIIYLPKLGAKTVTSTMRNSLTDRVRYTVKTRANLYLADYAQDVLLPNLKECGTAINTDCYAGKVGETQRHQTLYDSWKKGKIMDRINQRYAFTFKAGASDNYEDIQVYKDGQYVTNYKSYYDSGLAIEHVMGITEAQGVNERWLMRHTVNVRFGGKWCIMLCADSDALTNENLDLLDKMKLKVSSRVISKSAARIATLLACGPSCTPEILATTARTAAKQALEVADSKFLREIFQELGSGKLVEFLTTKVIEGVIVLTQGIAKTAGFLASLPLKAWHTFTSVVAGSINFIQGLIETKEINEFQSEKNLGEYNDVGSSVLSSVDEVATGKAPLRQQGAVFRYLRQVPTSRMYQYIRGISPKSPEVCQDGTVLQGEDDPMTCPEQHIIQDYDPQTVISNPYFGFFSKVVDGLAKGLSFIPGLGGLTQIADIKDNIGKSLGLIVEKQIPPIFTEDPGGSPFAGVMIAGSLMGEDYAYNSGFADIDGGRIGMAGAVMDTQTQASLDVAIAKDKDLELEHQSLFARYLSPENPTSLFSSAMLNVATAMPMLIDEPVHFHFNPFSFIGNLGMALGFSQKASAQGAIALGDRSRFMKIPSVGYTTAELAVKPKTLTEPKCSELYAAWEAGIEENPDGMKLPTVANICAADDMTILDLTGFTRLKDRAALDAYNTSPVAGQSATGPLPTGEGCEPNTIRQVQTQKGSIYVCKVGIFTVNTTMAQKFSDMMRQAANEKQNFGGSALRDHLTQHSLRRTNGCPNDGSWTHKDGEDPTPWAPASACKTPTAKPGNSQHEQGLAIDFTYNGSLIKDHGNPGWQWLNTNAGKYGFYNLASEPWHWSTTGN